MSDDLSSERARRTLLSSPSIESIESARTRTSYSHDYASDDYESEDGDDGHAVGSTISSCSQSSSSSSSMGSDSRPSPARSATGSNIAQPRFPTSSTSSLQNFFGPPFYGRPPTPLPPSPSLTSLLRPSRPTTPDGSDEDATQTHGPLGPDYRGGHAQHHPHNADNEGPVPRTSPRVPTYEYYGFILYLFSSLSFGLYLLWAFLPSPFLHALGIYYYPNRWWALAVPSFLVACVLYIYVALAAYNTEILTVKIPSVEAMVDGASNIAVVDSEGRIGRLDRCKNGDERDDKTGIGGPAMPDWKIVWSVGTDAVMDVPLAGVCEVLYGGEETDTY